MWLDHMSNNAAKLGQLFVPRRNSVESIRLMRSIVDRNTYEKSRPNNVSAANSLIWSFQIGIISYLSWLFYLINGRSTWKYAKIVRKFTLQNSKHIYLELKFVNLIWNVSSLCLCLRWYFSRTTIWSNPSMPQPPLLCTVIQAISIGHFSVIFRHRLPKYSNFSFALRLIEQFSVFSSLFFKHYAIQN